MIETTETNQLLAKNLTARPATLADATAVTQLANHCAVQLNGKADTSVADTKSEWQYPTFDLETQSRLIQTESGQIVGAGEIYIDPIPIRNFLWARVHPEYENQGIGTYLLRWAEARTRQEIHKAPSDKEVVLMVAHDTRVKNAKRLFEGYGLHKSRSYYTMEIELHDDMPAPQFPNHIRLTTFAEHNDLPNLWRANEESFQDHWGFNEQPEAEGIAEWQHYIDTNEHYDPNYWFIALDGNEIAGYCNCMPTTSENPEKAHVNRLGVRRPWRKQGLGMALLLHAFHSFHQIGKKRVDLGVDATSLTGATRLYEKAGMRVVKQADAYEKVLREAEAATAERE